MISCGTCCGERLAAAISLVTRSSATTVISVPQKRGVLDLPLSIFFALLALDAISGVRQSVESLEADLLAAVVAFSELLRISINPAQRFVDMPQEATFLTREKKCLLALHGIRTLIGHVERVRAQIPVRSLRRGSESFVVVTKLLQNALPLLEQALLKMLKTLLRHCFWLLTGCCCHL